MTLDSPERQFLIEMHGALVSCRAIESLEDSRAVVVKVRGEKYDVLQKALPHHCDYCNQEIPFDSKHTGVGLVRVQGRTNPPKIYYYCRRCVSSNSKTK